MPLPSDTVKKYVTLRSDKTSSDFGSEPEASINKGIIILDKPSGPTSHEVTSWVRKIAGVKAGHAGTLDPGVSGVLPIGLGKATRVLDLLSLAGKEYVCILELSNSIPEEKIHKVFSEFVGEISQTPPKISAVRKVRRTRTIYYLDIPEIKYRYVLFRVGCQAGTYIRVLCKQIGSKLDAKGKMHSLRRTRVGSLLESDSIILQNVKDAFALSSPEQILLSVESVLSFVPSFYILDTAVNSICYGSDLNVPGISKLSTDIKKGDWAAVFTLKGELVALGKALFDVDEIQNMNHGKVFKTERVIMEKDIYPRTW
jgi:H/ACA ribonucleoprotein complex subunit 4